MDNERGYERLGAQKVRGRTPNLIPTEAWTRVREIIYKHGYVDEHYSTLPKKYPLLSLDNIHYLYNQFF